MDIKQKKKRIILNVVELKEPLFGEPIDVKYEWYGYSNKGKKVIGSFMYGCCINIEIQNRIECGLNREQAQDSFWRDALEFGKKTKFENIDKIIEYYKNITEFYKNRDKIEKNFESLNRFKKNIDKIIDHHESPDEYSDGYNNFIENHESLLEFSDNIDKIIMRYYDNFVCMSSNERNKLKDELDFWNNHRKKLGECYTQKIGYKPALVSKDMDLNKTSEKIRTLYDFYKSITWETCKNIGLTIEDYIRMPVWIKWISERGFVTTSCNCFADLCRLSGLCVERTVEKFLNLRENLIYVITDTPLQMSMWQNVIYNKGLYLFDQIPNEKIDSLIRNNPIVSNIYKIKIAECDSEFTASNLFNAVCFSSFLLRHFNAETAVNILKEIFAISGKKYYDYYPDNSQSGNVDSNNFIGK